VRRPGSEISAAKQKNCLLKICAAGQMCDRIFSRFFLKEPFFKIEIQILYFSLDENVQSVNVLFVRVLTEAVRYHHSTLKKKVSGFPVLIRYVTYQTLPGREELNYSRLRRESLVSDNPVRDGKTANLFLQFIVCGPKNVILTYQKAL
jgi:hypothetical protein